MEHDPELLQAAEEVVRRTAWLPGAPVVVPLRQLGVLALTGPAAGTRALARSLLCELAAFHAPDDLRIEAIHPPSARPAWEWTTWLPHARDPTTAGGQPSASLLTGARADASPYLVAILDRTEPGQGGDPSPARPGSGAPSGHGGEVRVAELLQRSAAVGVTVIWLAEATAGEVPAEGEAKA